MNLQTMLKVLVWVRDTTIRANSWIDVHVFDGYNELIHSTTLGLQRRESGSPHECEFSGEIYQGATATPGSAQPRPEARKVQYRLYHQINSDVFTDGILHQLELRKDEETNWPVASTT